MRTFVVMAAALGVVTLLFCACGGDDPTPAERDEAYVVAFCNATRTFQAEAERLDPGAEPSADDLAKLGPVIREYAKALDRAKPPSDVEARHERFVAELKKAADLLEKRAEGDPFLGLEQLEPLPAEVGARLDAVIAVQPACKDLALSFTG